MPCFPLSNEHFFSENKKVEKFFRKVLVFAAVAIIPILFLYWGELGSQELIRELVTFSATYKAVEFFFRAFTFLADNEFLILLISVLIWCFNRTLGYTTAAVLLAAGGYNSLLKEIFALPRPTVEGVVLPGGYSFPSGHTLLGVVTWGFLGLKVKRKDFWLWAFTAVLLIGFSRLMLGYHFARDVLGGLLFGFVFLVLLLHLGPLLARKVRRINLSSNWIMLLSILVPLLVVCASQVILQREGVILFMGYISGAVFGYACTDRTFSPARPGENWSIKLLKVFTGTVGLIIIIWGIPVLLPGEPFLLFPLYFLAGLWASFLAPVLFEHLGLLKLYRKEDAG